jgi:hypothetical protein
MYYYMKIMSTIPKLQDNLSYLDQGPLAAQMHRYPDWDSLDRLIPYQHLHSAYQGNLQRERERERERERIIDFLKCD